MSRLPSLIMVQLSFRGLMKAPSAAPATTPSPAPASTSGDGSLKKTRFNVSEEEKKAGAATMLQKFARGKSTRSMKKGGDPEKPRPAELKAPVNGAERPARLSRRVSFSSNPMGGWMGQVQLFCVQFNSAVRGCLEQVSAPAEPEVEGESNYKVEEGKKPELSAKAREMVRQSCRASRPHPIRDAMTQRLRHSRSHDHVPRPAVALCAHSRCSPHAPVAPSRHDPRVLTRCR